MVQQELSLMSHGRRLIPLQSDVRCWGKTRWAPGTRPVAPVKGLAFRAW